MGVTDDPNDPALTRGVDDEPTPMASTYLVLSDEERAKGFVRPLRTTYRHVGRPGPRFALVDLTDEQFARFGATYVKWEPYPESELPATGRYWTQDQLDAVGVGCGSDTRMGLAIAETYARQPSFYGATFCVACSMHRPVGVDGEFVWVESDGSTGPRVGT